MAIDKEKTPIAGPELEEVDDQTGDQGPEDESDGPSEITSLIEACTSVDELDNIQEALDAKRKELSPSNDGEVPSEYSTEDMPKG
jgi:hypothetical protein